MHAGFCTLSEVRLDFIVTRQVVANQQQNVIYGVTVKAAVL